MSLKQSNLLKKAQTHPFALPNINQSKERYLTARKLQNKSTYLQRVKDETLEESYGYIETEKINQEQKHLKNLLRRFNEEAYTILGNYIDNPLQRRKKKSSQSIMELSKKQFQNTNEILEICQKELTSLEMRTQNLKFMDYQGFKRKINQLKYERDEMIEVNKQIKKNNTLRGQQIKKDDSKNYHEGAEIDHEIYVLSLKKQRLEDDTKYTNDQQQSLKQKHAAADARINEISVEYEKIKAELEQEKLKLKRKQQLEEKKKQYKHKKQHNQQIKTEYIYLKMLKELQEQTKKCKQAEKKTKQTQDELEKSKKQLVQLEQKYKSIHK